MQVNPHSIPTGYTLLQAHLILRHGDRAPTANIYSSPPNGTPNGKTAQAKAVAEASYWNSQMPSPLALKALTSMFPITFLDTNNLSAATNQFHNSAKAAPFGLLTQRGLHQTFSLGAELRQLYVDEAHLLPTANTCTQVEAVTARSTAMKRTVQSCQSVLHGFCRPSSFNEGAGTVPVQVETGAALSLPNFGFMREKCPLLVQKWHASMSSAHVKQVEEDTTPLLNQLKKHYPMLKSKKMSHTSKLLKSFDHFKTHQAHGLATAPGTDEKTMHALKLWARDVFWRLYANQHATQTTLLCSSILSSMEARIQALSTESTGSTTITTGAAVPKMCIYSGHDTTVMPLLATLKCVVPTPEAEWPPYGAHVRVELLEKDQHHHVRIVYQDHVVLRSMDEFRELILSQQQDLSVECQIDDRSGEPGLNPFQDNR